MPRMRSLIALPVAVAALIWSTDSKASTNLIVNGSFDTPDVGFDYDSFANGQVPGWTNTLNDDGIEIDNAHDVMNGVQYNSATPHSAELNGLTFDTISQTVLGLTVGETYTLSWGYGDRLYAGPQEADVYFGGVLVGSDYGTGSGVWTSNSVTVTATSTSEVLSFAAVDTSAEGGAPGMGNEITAVSLIGTTDVPEPASIALLGLGLTGLAAARRKRNANA